MEMSTVVAIMVTIEHKMLIHPLEGPDLRLDAGYGAFILKHPSLMLVLVTLQINLQTSLGLNSSVAATWKPG